MNDLEKHLSELNDAASRAGAVINERVEGILAAAEREADQIRRNASRDADEIRRTAEREAEETRRGAEQEADESRRHALNSVDRVFERINSLERPLADLVGSLRFEADQVERELEGHVEGEAIAIAPEAESDAQDASDADASVTEEAIVEAVEEPSSSDASAPVERGPIDAPRAVEAHSPDPSPSAQPGEAGPPVQESWRAPTGGPQQQPPREDESAAAGGPPAPAPWQVPEGGSEESPEPVQTSARPQPPPGEPPPFMVSEPSDSGKSKGFFSRLKPGGSKRPFIDTPGHCAVCQKSFQAKSEEALRASGWQVNDDVGLCPEDQADGWQLPEGARLPFRRGGG